MATRRNNCPRAIVGALTGKDVCDVIVFCFSNLALGGLSQMVEELRDVVISHGLLTGRCVSDGCEVAVPVQPPVVAAPVPIEWNLKPRLDVQARLNRVNDRGQFRFEFDGTAVSAVAVDASRADRMNRHFTNKSMRISVGGQSYRAKTSQAHGSHSIDVVVPGRGADLFHALALLRRSHPRGIPPSGIVITAKFSDHGAEMDVRKVAKRAMSEAKDKTLYDPWSPAWNEGTGLVVGAVTVSRLFHGNPKGRFELAQGMGIKLPESDDRGDIVKELGVVWVSRIAVDAPYRHCGIGTLLLDQLRTSIGATLPWLPRVIEVMQSVPSASAAETGGSKFFTDAGYRYERATYTPPTRMIDATGRPESKLTPLRTLYYWAPVEPPA